LTVPSGRYRSRFSIVASRGFRNHKPDFNYDFHVSFTPEELAAGRAYYNYVYTNPDLAEQSGDSVFCKDEAGQIFHTYSSFARGGEEFLGIYPVSRRHAERPQRKRSLPYAG
jgi:predicted dithiol-disulfide oxidoreductase (DUF899 family)